MKTDTPAPTGALTPHLRSRNKRVLFLAGIFFGILISESGKFLADYDGPVEVKVALVLALFVGGAVLVLFSRRFYREDELEILISRKALAFAVNAALVGLCVLYILEAARFAPKVDWSTRGVLGSLGVLVLAGVLWSKRQYR